MPNGSIGDHFDERSPTYEISSPWVCDDRSLRDAVAVLVAGTPPRVVLDLGAGTGAFGAAVASACDAAPTIVSLDASAGMLKQSKLGYRVVGDGHTLPLADRTFDAVLVRQAFHYFAQPALVLAEIRRVLVSGGWLVLSQIVPFDEMDDVRFWRRAVDLRQPLRLHGWTAPELRATILGAGFSIQSETEVATRGSLNSWIGRYSIDREIAEALREHFVEWRAADSGIRRFEDEGDDITYQLRWVTFVGQFGTR